MRRHIENLKQKPEHVRHNVAFGVAAGMTGIVAITWLVAHAATGTFTLQNRNLEPTPDESRLTETVPNSGGLLGAAGEAFAPASKEPELTIVDGDTRSTLEPAPENDTDATVIPF